MTDLRTIAIDSELIALIERVGQRLLNQNEVDGIKLLALGLSWRSIGRPVFECHVDESAGLAEAQVVELLGYSKKVPCQ